MPKATTPDLSLAVALRQLREKSNVSQEDLAHHAGITVGTLSRLETGRASPSWATVRQLASALGVSLRDLGAAVEAQEQRG